MTNRIYARQKANQQVTERLKPLFCESPIHLTTPPPTVVADVAVPVFQLAKDHKKNPADFAADLAAKVDIKDSLINAVTASGGYLNFAFDPAQFAQAVFTDFLHFGARYGGQELTKPERVVIDYSSPNVAKEMHVGHLRSTIIGDALARTLMFLGYDVVRQNHLGDWGTQFGMLIEYLFSIGWDQLPNRTIRDLDQLYQEAKQKFDREPDFAAQARARVVALQTGDAATRTIWTDLVAESTRHFTEIYHRLGVLLTEADLKPESSYNEALSKIVDELKEAKLAVESEGATVIFVPGFADKDGQPVPMIIQKSDGSYLYATTDLATLAYRIKTLHGQHLLYVVDSRQRDHFAMLFAVGEAADWLTKKTRAVHINFGTILGSDHRPFKTRDGGTIKLVDLLDEAVERAFTTITEKKPDLPETDRRAIAAQVGVGAVKFADLSIDRTKDYVFDWDRMLAFDGYTAPYLQYARVRILSILRKATQPIDPSRLVPDQLTEPTERRLIQLLSEFPLVVAETAASYQPYLIAQYLFQLAQAFTEFYNTVPVLKTPDQALRDTRLELCRMIALVLETGLSLLGIEAPDRM